jgi:hypothetical protein
VIIGIRRTVANWANYSTLKHRSGGQRLKMTDISLVASLKRQVNRLIGAADNLRDEAFVALLRQQKFSRCQIS